MNNIVFAGENEIITHHYYLHLSAGQIPRSYDDIAEFKHYNGSDRLLIRAQKA